MLLDRALAAQPHGELTSEVASSDETQPRDEKESVGHVIYKHLMNGVSHMLVFVVAGGVLTSLLFLWGITSFNSTASDYNSFAAMLKIIGGIVGGFLAGYVIVGLEKLLSGMPKNLDGLKAMFLYPLISTFIVGLIMLGISGPMVTVNTAMMNFLKSLSASGPFVLGLAIGCMCAFDMGGPVNKAAYVTGTALLTEALTAGVGTDFYNFGTNFMAAVSAACIAPPLITSFAVLVGKKYFSHEDYNAGLVNIIFGCTHITEGAIPFMTKKQLACYVYYDGRFIHCGYPHDYVWGTRPGTTRRLSRPARC